MTNRPLNLAGRSCQTGGVMGRMGHIGHMRQRKQRGHIRRMGYMGRMGQRGQMGQMRHMEHYQANYALPRSNPACTAVPLIIKCLVGAIDQSPS